MAADKYGYRYGPRLLVQYGVDSSVATALTNGDHVKWATAGYVTVCGAGDNPIGVVAGDVTPGSADGDVSVMVDISEWSVYEYPPDSGSVTVGLVGLTADLGGARSIDIDASADDNIKIVQVDTVKNTVFVRHLFPTTGVA